jgi:hypothetical protein
MVVTGSAYTSSLGVTWLFTVFYTLTIYNSLEIITLVLVTFKKYKGPYFWSLLIATVCLIISTIGSVYYFYSPSPYKIPPVALGLIGWAGFVTGQAIVLWSRLHLVVQSEKVLRGVLIMIIANAIIFEIPTFVLCFIANSPNAPAKTSYVYSKWEDVQLSFFCVQETIISGIYIRETIGLLKIGFDRRKRNMIYQLLAINIMILAMDVVLLGIQYSNQRTVQIQLKGTIYSFKLKLEFAVLSRLVNFVGFKKQRTTGQDSTPSFIHLNDAQQPTPTDSLCSQKTPRLTEAHTIVVNQFEK